MKLQKYFVFFLAAMILFFGALSFFRGDLFGVTDPLTTQHDSDSQLQQSQSQSAENGTDAQVPEKDSMSQPSGSSEGSEGKHGAPQQEASSSDLATNNKPTRSFSPLLGEVQLVFEGTTEPDENGRFYEQVVVKTQKKYPLLIQQDIYELSDTASGGIVSRGQRLFVADHAVVRVKEGYDAALVQSTLQKIDMAIRKKMNDSGLYLVEFPVGAFDSWNKAVEKLKSEEMVQAVTPDIFSQTLR